MPPVFRYTLSRFFCFMQEKRFFHFPLRRGWADRVVRPYNRPPSAFAAKKFLKNFLEIAIWIFYGTL